MELDLRIFSNLTMIIDLQIKDTFFRRRILDICFLFAFPASEYFFIYLRYSQLLYKFKSLVSPFPMQRPRAQTYEQVSIR